jgi:hypothetical protein
MEERLENLFQEWHQLGAAVLLKEAKKSLLSRSPEEILAESTAYCRHSGRLTWVVVDWMIHHIQIIDENKLLKLTKEKGNLSVLGVLCDLARLKNPHHKFDRIVKACAPNNKLEIFFHRVAKSPLAERLTKENPLEIFIQWNYLCNELRYL